MPTDIVLIGSRLTEGDRYTVWAPGWRDEGDEWEAFLGKDEDLYAFERPLTWSHSRTNTDNDLINHPAWKGLTEASASKFDPADDHQYDLVALKRWSPTSRPRRR